MQVRYHGQMKDRILRAVCFWIAVFAGLASVAGILVPPVRFILPPCMIFVGATAFLLFLRMLFSRTYRQGIDAVNREMQGNGSSWRGRRIKLLDPDWGLFGSRAGSPALLWLRAVLFLGAFVMQFLRNRVGDEVFLLWIAGTFVAMSLSMMHAALSQPR